MSAFAAAAGRAYAARIVQGRRHGRHASSNAYIAPHDHIPSSTADLWRGGRPRPCR